MRLELLTISRMADLGLQKRIMTNERTLITAGGPISPPVNVVGHEKACKKLGLGIFA